MTVVFLGIDLAKNVFVLHGVDAAGKPCLVRPQVRRDQLAELVARLPPCAIAWRPVRARATLAAAARITK